MRVRVVAPTATCSIDSPAAPHQRQVTASIALVEDLFVLDR